MIIFNCLVYIPVFAKVFNHGPINILDWGFLLLLVPTLLIADELRKLVVRRQIARRALAGNDTSVSSMSPIVRGAAGEETA